MCTHTQLKDSWSRRYLSSNIFAALNMAAMLGKKTGDTTWPAGKQQMT